MEDAGNSQGIEGFEDILVLQDEFPESDLGGILHLKQGRPGGDGEGSRTGDILVEAGLVTRGQVEAVIRRFSDESQGGDGKRPKVGELLVKGGLITEEQLVSALAKRYGFRFIDLSTVTPSAAALAAVSPGLALKLQVLPVSLDKGKLVAATSTPTDHTTESSLKFNTNCSVELVVSSARQISAAIEKYYLHRGQAVDTLLDSMKAEGESAVEEVLEEERYLFEPDSKIVSLVNHLLVDAYQRGASDIHFEPGPGREPLVVRYRIDGECTQGHSISSTYKWAVIARIKILAQLDIAERRHPQSGKILLRYRNEKLEYRVETTPLVGGRESAVLRLLVASAKPIPLEDLGLTPHNLKRFHDLLDKPYGMILCVGPTGSGKTSTLHSALGHINCAQRKIWTAEDPVEITQPGLCQVQINSKIGFTFAEALRSFLRADPDVIMIGEMRDSETAKIAIEASLTGHLVMSTLHTNSAPETAVRLTEMGMDPFSFADALLGIVAQRLAKRLCPNCKRPATGRKELYDHLVVEFERSAGRKLETFPAFGDARLMEKNGCEECNGSGYKGRIAIHELMLATPPIKRAIKHQSGLEALRETALREGMITLKMDGIMKVLNGETDQEQILRVCM